MSTHIKPVSKRASELMSELNDAAYEYRWQEYRGVVPDKLVKAERRYEKAKDAMMAYVADLEDRPPL